MASISKTHFHVRYVSRPSKSSQISEYDDLEATTSSSIDQEIKGLNYLYSSFDNVLKEDRNDGVNELLDELLKLLELCSTVKDALSSTKDSAQQLQSVLRKRGDYIGILCAIQEYQPKRKAIKKAIVKALRNLKSSSVKKNQETPLREMESVTLRVLESFLCFVLVSSSKMNSNKWSVISKMLSPKQSSEECLVGKVDVELDKKSACFKVENMHKKLAQMELMLEHE